MSHQLTYWHALAATAHALLASACAAPGVYYLATGTEPTAWPHEIIVSASMVYLVFFGSLYTLGAIGVAVMLWSIVGWRSVR